MLQSELQWSHCKYSRTEGKNLGCDFFFFETKSYYIASAGLTLTVFISVFIYFILLSFETESYYADLTSLEFII